MIQRFLCKWELRIIFYVVAVSIHTRYIMYVLHDLHVFAYRQNLIH
ncbi:hypothetical protein ExPCM15_00929 [Escherichia coli]|nr:hypothetical protein ExPCM15_00929 [Escherichia coli]